MAKLENLIENAGFDKFPTERFSQVLSHLLSETVERCCVRSRVVKHHDIVALRSELGIDLQSSDNRRVAGPLEFARQKPTTPRAVSKPRLTMSASIV